VRWNATPITTGRSAKTKDKDVPELGPFDRNSTRLAGLLHDIGHGPFSHVTEVPLQDCASAEFDALRDLLRERYDGVTKIAPSEIVAVVIVLSEEMKQVFEHPHFEAVDEPTQLAPAIAGRILGSRTALKAGYLSGVISGPIDADKLDYMARDSLHTGLPLGLDLERLISKLEVVIIRTDNAPNDDLRRRADASPSKRVYEMGISLSGLGAYEQMIIGRVILYDRLYHHHKIRTAESMVRCLISVVREESQSLTHLSDFLSVASDDTFLAILGGMIQSGDLRAGGVRAEAIACALLDRKIYHRAYAFAAKFLAGLDGLPEEERQETRFLLWDAVFRQCLDPDQRRKLEQRIYDVARELAACVPGLAGTASGLLQDHIVVDLPVNRAVITGNDILVRTEGGEIALPTLYFDPERWSKAYEHQKLVGYVSTPRMYIPLVATAAKIVFYERFTTAMNREADKASKTFDLVTPEWILKAAEQGLCSPACVAALVEHRSTLARIHPEHLRLPEDWQTSDPELAKRLADGFDRCLPAGLPATVHGAIIDAIEHLTSFIRLADQTGLWVSAPDITEKALQDELRKHLRSREVNVIEGSEVAGGETDLVLPGSVVVENKVRERTADPFETGLDYEWQARRYSVSMVSQVSFVVVAYRPASEAAILPLTQRIRVMQPLGTPENHAFVRVVLPWGQGVPSRAKSPK
jgi:HD domain-containing protein